jgi:hypothetical protein
MKEVYKSHVSIYLQLEKPNSKQFSANFTMGILDSSKKEYYNRKYAIEIEDFTLGYGIPQVIHHDALFDSEEFVVNGKLTFVCKVRLNSCCG